MQLASHGLRGVARKKLGVHLPGHAPPNAFVTNGQRQRAIHIPPASQFVPKPSISNVGTVPRVLSQARAALGRFVAHLTAPGLGVTSAAHGHALSGSARSGIHTGAARLNAHASIKQGMSFPARVALSRPLRPPFFPRPPVCPRSTIQVGLGTARNFSTGRPIFQHLMENVPIAGRAFYEADWDMHLQKERDLMFQKAKKAKKVKKTQEMMKSKAQSTRVKTSKASEIFSVKHQNHSTATEFEHYFALPSTPAVTTYLLIPLAPTPTTRTPLSDNPEPHSGRLPLAVLGAIHANHSTHALRVSALFSRLDASNVWARGVTCDAYAHSAAGSPDADELDAALGVRTGVCTVLKVVFPGWTKAEVRGVLGESGSGWCVLDEVNRPSQPGSGYISPKSCEDDDLDSVWSGMTSEPARSDPGLGLMMLMPPDAAELDPGRSFVLPTLDFSSSFASAVPSPAHSSAPSAKFSDYGSDFDYQTDMWSDVGTGSDVSDISDLSRSSSNPEFVDPPSENGHFSFGVGFSSAFTARAASRNVANEPMENLFY